MLDFVEDKWRNYCVQALVDVLRHPMDYARVLMQVGYEPIPPQAGLNLFGDTVLLYPNMFAYIRHIRDTDGFFGCFRGVLLKITGDLLAALSSDYLTAHHLKPEEPIPAELSLRCLRHHFLLGLKIDVILCTVAVVVSEPFHLLTVRRMCQFVGKETVYDGFFQSVGNVYHFSGLLGFYSGFWPRLIGEILAIMLTNFFTLLVYCLFVWYQREEGVPRYVKAGVGTVGASIMYPFKVVSKCMSVVNSGLKAGTMPAMKPYGSWLECWVDLSARRQLKRGASMFFRLASEAHAVDKIKAY